MHITQEFAGLLAQVFPTLLIALLLEARFLRPSGFARWYNLVHFVVRYVAIIGALTSTFVCLLVSGLKGSADFVDITVTATLFALMGAFVFMVGDILGGEMAHTVGQFVDGRRSRSASPSVKSQPSVRP